MAVKEEHRQNEVGMIPYKWELAKLGTLATFRSGEGIIISELSSQSSDASIPVFGGNGIAGYTNRMMVIASTIVIGRVGQKCGEVYLTDGPAWITDNALFPSTLSPRVSKEYLAVALRGAGLNSVKNRNDLPLITQTILNGFSIPLPPTLAEQEAIAGALSDADAWIESLEQLIAKKRQIKQGAMQELLTGKRRLPGFSGEWTKSTLGDLGRWMGGMTPSMSNCRYWETGDFPWVSSGDVKSTRLTDTSQHITNAAIRESTTTVLPSGSIIIVNRSGILRRYLPVSLLKRDMAINQDIKGLILKPEFSSEFVLYSVLNAGPMILSTCMKSGTTVESIELNWLKRFEIMIPGQQEQIAIAKVLSELDTEINSLEFKLAKARRIKQGMMQELLTGRIRLV